MTERPGEMDERDIDARFASIVAGWESATPTRGTASDDESTSRSTELRPPPPAEDGAGTAVRGAEQTDHESASFVAVPSSSWRASSPAEPEQTRDDAGAEEHFEPPAVELPPHEDLHFWGAVVGLVLGPTLLVYVALARPFHSARWFAAAVLLTLIGFGLLLVRQPRDRDPTDPDDGARV
ncbi:MAG: hypothetical protein ACRCYX_01955 [Dermatophilaceae bacterium]